MLMINQPNQWKTENVFVQNIIDRDFLFFLNFFFSINNDTIPFQFEIWNFEVNWKQEIY